MAKRFTDTDKWRRPWFRALPDKYKLLWLYILDNCEISGIWYADFELASFLIGSELDREEALITLDKQVQVLGDGSRWLVNDFVYFQYGELKPTNNLHRSVLSSLSKAGLPTPDDPQNIPSRGDKVMVMVKDKVKEKKGVVGGSRKKSDYQLLIEHFAENRGIKLENEAQTTQFFAAHGEAAKNILAQASNDLGIAKLAVTEIAAYADDQVKIGKWEPWKNLKALSKLFIEWKSEYDKEKNGEVRGGNQKA